jgi:hypothetical protein
MVRTHILHIRRWASCAAVGRDPSGVARHGPHRVTSRAATQESRPEGFRPRIDRWSWRSLWRRVGVGSSIADHRLCQVPSGPDYATKWRKPIDQRGSARFSAVQRGSARFSAVQRGSARFSAVQRVSAWGIGSDGKHRRQAQTASTDGKHRRRAQTASTHHESRARFPRMAHGTAQCASRGADARFGSVRSVAIRLAGLPPTSPQLVRRTILINVPCS